MGKISILSQNQKKILSEIAADPYFQKRFYFTGGTALAEFYLQHRFSFDLDFFSPQELENEIIFNKVSRWSKKHHFTIKNSRFVEVVYRFEVEWKGEETFGIDFSSYPYPQLEKGKNYRGLPIDSLKDIAVNKLLTINQRSEVKDFVDLYFLLRKKFNIWELIYGTEYKFSRKVDILLLAEDLLGVEDFDYLPQMIKPLTLKKLKTFFRQLALQLGKKAVE